MVVWLCGCVVVCFRHKSLSMSQQHDLIGITPESSTWDTPGVSATGTQRPTGREPEECHTFSEKNHSDPQPYREQQRAFTKKKNVEFSTASVDCRMNTRANDCQIQRGTKRRACALSNTDLNPVA